LSFSVSGDMVEPAVYAAKIENCGDCWVTVYLDRTNISGVASEGENQSLPLARGRDKTRPTTKPYSIAIVTTSRTFRPPRLSPGMTMRKSSSGLPSRS
jgi:hypothetical protein